MPLPLLIALLLVPVLLLAALGYAIRDTARSRRRLDEVYRAVGYQGPLAPLAAFRVAARVPVSSAADLEN